MRGHPQLQVRRVAAAVVVVVTSSLQGIELTAEGWRRLASDLETKKVNNVLIPGKKQEKHQI